MRQLIIYRRFFTNADCYTRGTKQTSVGVQVHSTGANNPYLKRYVQPDDGRLGKNTNGNSHNRKGLNVCASAYIGKLAYGGGLSNSPVELSLLAVRQRYERKCQQARLRWF